MIVYYQSAAEKDSMFQSYKLKNTYNLNPLSVTHSQNWLSTIGRYNLKIV